MAVKVTVYGTADMRQIENARKELDRLESTARKASTGFAASMSRAGSAMQSAGTRIADVGGAMTRTLTPAVVAAGAGIWKATQMASDLAETTSKVGVIFGKTSGEIEKWAGTAATSMGQSKQQAMDAAATFAMFGQSAGLSGKNLVGFSTEFAALASDMASFNNTTPEEAITAIGAALRGEMEPIRKYNVLLNDQVLREEARAMGIYKGNGALTAQQKVLASSSLIFKQTTKQQGDFARTSNQLANQQRIASAELKNQVTELGTAFIPMMLTATTVLREKVIPAIKGLSEWFTGLSPATRQAIVLAGLFVGALGPVVLVAGNVIKALGLVTSGIGTMASAMTKSITVMRAFATGFAQPASGASAFASAAQKAGAAVRTAMATMATAVKNAMLAIGRALLANPWLLAVAAVIAAVVLIVKNWDKVKTFVLASWQAIKSAASTVWNAIVGIVKGAASKVWSAIQAYFGFYKKMATFGLQLVQGLWAGITNAGAWIKSKIKGWTDQILNDIKGFFGIASPSKETTKIGVFLSEGIAKGMTDAEPKVTKAAKTVTDKALKASKAAAAKAAKEVATAAAEAAAKARDAAQAQLDTVRDGMSAIGDQISSALDAVEEAANRLVYAAEDSWTSASDRLANLRDEARSFASSIRDSLRGVFSLRDALSTDRGGTFLGNLREQLASMTTFAGQIRSLRGLGLNEASMQEIIQAGVEQGSQIAAAILSGGSSAVAEINSLEAQITEQATSLGNLFAEDKFGAELSKAEKNLLVAQQSLAAATASRDATLATIDAQRAATDRILGKSRDGLDALVSALSKGLGDTKQTIADILAMIGSKIGQLQSLSATASGLAVTAGKTEKPMTASEILRAQELYAGTTSGSAANFRLADQLLSAGAKPSKTVNVEAGAVQINVNDPGSMSEWSGGAYGVVSSAFDQLLKEIAAK